MLANKYFGLAQQNPGNLGVSVLEIDGYRILRSYGSLPHPNILGGFLFVSIIVGIYLWVNFYKKNYYYSKNIKIKNLYNLFL